MKKSLLTTALFILFGGTNLFAQNTDFGEIHGNFQADIQYYKPDSIIGAPVVPEKMLMNGFANVIYTKGLFTAGLRYESYLNAIQGFDPRYKGTGIPYRFANYQKGNLDVTVGNYYEQFGNGLIFRSYEERGLGVDNAMDGIRLKYQVTKGVYFKGIYGKQRSFFAQGPGIVRGADIEVQLNELLTPDTNINAFRVTLGGGMVSRYQPDLDPQYKLPENVSAAAGRINIGKGNFNIMGEYAYKINDPSSANNLIYKNGAALLIGASYSQKGLGINVSAKRVDNMDFRSDRTAVGNNLTLNFLPPITKQHTYMLMAFYPYATQNQGEMGFQGEVFYKFSKGSRLGGTYGTEVALNYSRVNGLDTIRTTPYEGYRSDFTKFGDRLYFQDANIEITKKISKKFKTVLTYANIIYNIEVVQGLVGKGTVNTNVAVVDLTWYITDKYSLRTELQNMSVKDNKDRGSWGAGLLELSVAPKWFISVLDQYNYGNHDPALRVHYLLGQVAFVKESNRFSISYGRQRQGIMCVGGICRNVPASNGVTLSVTSSF